MRLIHFLMLFHDVNFYGSHHESSYLTFSDLRALFPGTPPGQPDFHELFVFVSVCPFRYATYTRFIKVLLLDSHFHIPHTDRHKYTSPNKTRAETALFSS